MGTAKQPEGNRGSTAFIHKEETRQQGPGETRQVGQSRTIRRGRRQEGPTPGEKNSLDMITGKQSENREHNNNGTPTLI